MVKTFQIHSHSKSCRKYKKKKCRFNFPRFFTDETIIAQPFTGTESERKHAMKRKAEILNTVRNYIEEYLTEAHWCHLMLNLFSSFKYKIFYKKFYAYTNFDLKHEFFKFFKKFNAYIYFLNISLFF